MVSPSSFSSACTSSTTLFSHIRSDTESSILLRQWATHDKDSSYSSSSSYHDISSEEATLIRQALLDWYRIHRRKLPWRGDAPPYDGSTVGFGDTTTTRKRTSSTTSTKNTTIDTTTTTTTQQKTMTNFFAPKKVKKVIDAVTHNDDDEHNDEHNYTLVQQALPVTAYGVWVSEIMLQQTRVEAVIPFYIKWMKRFPTVYDLAEASEEDVNAHWAGLGFYRRARLLHQGAKVVVTQYNDGELPRTTQELLQISGIGPYTASAIASIAFDVCVPVVDGNVCRVLSRLRGIANHIKAPIFKDKLGWRLAAQIVNAGDGKHAGEVNQALMELGATYCAPSGTGMDDRDPLKGFYLSTKLAAAFDEERKHLATLNYQNFPIDTFLESALSSASSSSQNQDNKVSAKHSSCALCENNNIAAVFAEWNDAWNQGEFTISHGPFPLAPPKGTKREEVLAVAVLKNRRKTTTRNDDDHDDDDDDLWLLVKRPKTGLLAGQWEFPSVCVWSSADKQQIKGKKRKEGEVPLIQESVRTTALTEYLNMTLHENTEGLKRAQLQEPIEHVFSHVRHTMWIEHAVQSPRPKTLSWIGRNDKEVRWMSKKDMEKVGVTSGVKKILKAVETLSSTKTRTKKAKK